MFSRTLLAILTVAASPVENQAQPAKPSIMVAGTGPTESPQPASDGVIDTLSAAGLTGKVLSGDPRSRSVAVD